MKRRAQYQNVYKRGESFREANIKLFLLTNGLEWNRVGFSITSKRVKLSVKRNRCKRLLAESYRAMESRLKVGHDLVITVQKDISGHKMDGVAQQLEKVCKKSSILQ